MKTSNIMVLVFAIAFIIFIVWVGSMASQKPQPADTTTQTTSEATTTLSNPESTIKQPMSIATITTNKGVITLELFDQRVPNTVANFKKLAGEGFYNGTRFHRVIKGFMIQGGDPLSKDVSKQAYWGTGGPGYQFNDELTPENRNDIGTISMANAGPNTNGSQFFINTAANNFLDPKHVVFGRVTSGMDVVKTIEGVKTGAQDRPLEDMIIESITIK